jgi:hypothetical protein
MRLECGAQSWAWKSARQYALVTSGQFSAMTQPFLIKISLISATVRTLSTISISW